MNNVPDIVLTLVVISREILYRRADTSRGLDRLKNGSHIVNVYHPVTNLVLKDAEKVSKSFPYRFFSLAFHGR